MATGIALTLAALALLTALASTLITLWAVGRMAQLTTRLDQVDVKLAGFEGHRIRMDGNIITLANKAGLLASVNGVPLSSEPGRPQ